MVRVRDYSERELVDDRKVFLSEGNTPLDFKIMEVYEKDNQKMVRLRGLQGHAQFSLGSVRLEDISDCLRVYN